MDEPWKSQQTRNWYNFPWPYSMDVAPIAGYIILILTESEKLKAYLKEFAVDFALEPRTSWHLYQKSCTKNTWKGKLVKLLIAHGPKIKLLILATCYMKVTKTFKYIVSSYIFDFRFLSCEAILHNRSKLFLCKINGLLMHS